MHRSARLSPLLAALLACAARASRPAAPSPPPVVGAAPPARAPAPFRIRWNLADFGLPRPEARFAPSPSRCPTTPSGSSSVATGCSTRGAV